MLLNFCLCRFLLFLILIIENCPYRTYKMLTSFLLKNTQIVQAVMLVFIKILKSFSQTAQDPDNKATVLRRHSGKRRVRALGVLSVTLEGIAKSVSLILLHNWNPYFFFLCHKFVRICNFFVCIS